MERPPGGLANAVDLESDRDHNNVGRNTVEASLCEAYGTQMSGRGRLIDPVVVLYKGLGVLFADAEAEAENLADHWGEHGILLP